MAKSKKQVSDLEAIESYFTTGNEHRDKSYFKIYKEAEQEQIFDSLITPLWLINKIVSDCYENRNKPVQAVKKTKAFIEDAGLNYEQKCFIYDHLIKYLDCTVWTDEGGKQITLEQIKELLDNEFLSLAPERVKVFDEPFNWDKTKQHLATLPDNKAKIRYLTEMKTEYLQQKTGIDWAGETTFDMQCDLEIKKLKALAELESTPAQTASKPHFKLSKRTGAKTDLIRVLNALYELKFFVNVKETEPLRKKDFMQQVGQFFGTDLSNYDAALSQALREQPLPTNLKIFDEMKALTEKEHYESEERRTKNK